MINKDLDPRFVNDLYLFYQLFIVKKFASEPVPASHIRELSIHLMAITRGKLEKHLGVSMPPRHTKSSMVTIAYPLWLIFQNPNLNILIINNTSTLSEKFGIALRDCVEEYGSYFNVHLSDVKHSNTHLMFSNKEGKLYNGSIRLTGASGSITGQDADYIIIDDPYKGEDEEFTPTALQKKIDWFNRIVEQRVEPHTKLIILHTRWHSNDLIGYLQIEQDEDYKFITFPAILEDNTPLWPEKYTINDLNKKLRKVKERLFSALYQQKPLDETSDFFDIDKLEYTTLQPGEYIKETVRSWDIQSSDSLKADFTVGALLVRTNHNRIGVTHIVRGRFGNQTKQTILDAAASDGVNVKILIETGVAAAGDHLFTEWKLQLKGYRVYRSQAIKSKPDRATPLKNCILDEIFFLDFYDNTLSEQENNELIESVNSEFSSFPEGTKDDIIDAIAYGVNWLRKHFIINDGSNVEAKRYNDSLNDILKGRGSEDEDFL
jgi:phage terminase large subunit-like protein